MLAEYWTKYGRFAFLGVGIGLIILGLLIAFWGGESSNPALGSGSDVEFLSADQSPPPANLEIAVDVGGAVNYPGVYELPASSRVYQAIDKAGGASDQADSDWIEKNLNLARPLRDGEKIYLPARGEDTGDLQTGGVESGKYVNINTAAPEELETLPGIGPATAEKIIDYRQENNGFVSIEEIQAVSGIGEKMFEKLKDKISI